MLIINIELQTFSEANDFYFIMLTKLSASLNNTAITRLLLIKSDINHIIKVNSYLKHKSKLRFTAYNISEITQQLINITKSFFTIWKDHNLSVNLFKQNWIMINFKKDAELQSERMYSVLHQKLKVNKWDF